MITLSIYKKIGKQYGDIRNLHKAVKTLWQIVEHKESESVWYCTLFMPAVFIAHKSLKLK
jgi:hypothetical protein